MKPFYQSTIYSKMLVNCVQNMFPVSSLSIFIKENGHMFSKSHYAHTSVVLDKMNCSSYINLIQCLSIITVE